MIISFVWFVLAAASVVVAYRVGWSSGYSKGWEAGMFNMPSIENALKSPVFPVGKDSHKPGKEKKEVAKKKSSIKKIKVRVG